MITTCNQCGGLRAEPGEMFAGRWCECPLPPAPGYALADTSIEKGGVMRCCLGTVAAEYEGKQVRLGDKSKCLHCGTTFTLVEIKPGMQTCYRQPVKWPVWKPDWQLKDHNA